MINITYIYLIENIDNDPYKIYIGKTSNPKKRYSAHRHTYGDIITYNIIDNIPTLDQLKWKPIESYWIEQFKQWGFKVVNKNKGGGGIIFHTQENKEKISKRLLGNTYNKGTKYSEESKQKLRFSRPNSGPKGKLPEQWKLNLKVNHPKQWKPIIQYDIMGNIVKEWSSTTEASKQLGIRTNTINNCLKGLSKITKGYIWKYKTS
jgi:hypothetical protein